jgi:hypothetical protein
MSECVYCNCGCPSIDALDHRPTCDLRSEYERSIRAGTQWSIFAGPVIRTNNDVDTLNHAERKHKQAMYIADLMQNDKGR